MASIFVLYIAEHQRACLLLLIDLLLPGRGNKTHTLLKMTPFFLSRNSNGSGSSGFDDDDDIDRAMHRTNHHRRLLKYTTDLSIQQHTNDNSSVVAALSTMKEDNNNNTNNNTMTRAISMLEMNDIHDMVQFGEAMSALDVSPPPLKSGVGVQSPPSPLSVEENDPRNCVGAVYDMPLSVEEDRDTSTKPPRRSGSTGSNNNRMNMPLRSSLKKDSMNSLRSSLSKSAGSIGSEGDSGSIIKSNSMKRNVSFSSLEIRQYNVTLGDAPCSNAISLDWKYDPTATEQHNIDQYEQYRTDEAPRRVRSELVMTPAHRKYLLMREAGFSRHEINAAMKEARRVAKQREQTARYVRRGYQPYEEMLERTKRKLGKIGSIGGGSKKKELSS